MNLKGKRWQPLLTVVVFCSLIYGLAAATMLKPPLEFSETENRVLAQRPKIRAEAVLSGEFEADYEEYLTDQFIFRDQWIGLKTSIERLLLKRETKDIYFAGDDYLIERHTGSFTTELAKRNVEAIGQFAGQYAKAFGNGHFSVMIVPNAVDILEDKLPPYGPAGGGEDYLAQIENALPEGILFDAAAILREHRQEELYYRTDHHWKTLAAFYVYQAWAKASGCSVPELGDYEIWRVTDSFEGTIQSKLGIRTEKDIIELFMPKKEAAYTLYRESKRTAENSLYDYTALDTKDKYAVYLGGNEPFLQIRTDRDNGRRILVIKDSYANCFIPFMLGEFQEIDVLDLRYTNRKVSELIEAGGYTDLLVLYNVSGFAEDISIAKLTK